MTQQELATAIGVGQRTVSNWERGETIPRNRLGMLREFFGLNEADEDPLRALPDVALLSELMRRAIARDHGGRGSNAG